MKIRRSYRANGKTVEISYTHIPIRYVLAILITLLEIAAIIGIVILMCYYVPYFYVLALITQICCVVKIISSDDNPDYKAPWLLFVMVLPVAGFMLYFLFYSRKLNEKYSARFKNATGHETPYSSEEPLAKLKELDVTAYSHARMLERISRSKLYFADDVSYFPSGENMYLALLDDLRGASEYIFLEYFIIEEGKFWNSIYEILKERVKNGVEVRVLYDDIGCMNTLPGNFSSILKKDGIIGMPFSRLKGQADSEFNNRNHRKIAIIDGKVAYTGGINLADEYINEKKRFGHWKDTAIRITGGAVNELTKLFLVDYYIGSKDKEFEFAKYYRTSDYAECKNGYILPFGDGPKPLYEHRVSKLAIENLLSYAKEYVYITTPYLIIDNELCSMIESAALRGVEVNIVVPHVPDKKVVFEITRSFYQRLQASGVRIYEYTPGFIHSKMYIADGRYAIIGTVNLDYRSLVHHFENGVLMLGCREIEDMVNDFSRTVESSEAVNTDKKCNLFIRTLRAVGRIFAPLM